MSYSNSDSEDYMMNYNKFYTNNYVDSYNEPDVVDKCEWHNCRRMRINYKCRNSNCFSNREECYKNLDFDQYEEMQKTNQGALLIIQKNKLEQNINKEDDWIIL
jgi:hypothetical protein